MTAGSLNSNKITPFQLRAVTCVGILVLLLNNYLLIFEFPVNTDLNAINSKDKEKDKGNKENKTDILSNMTFSNFTKNKLSATKSSTLSLNLSTILDSQTHARLIGQSFARAFTYRNISTWCIKAKGSNPTPIGTLETNKGILFVRNSKCASSTVVGAILRISNKYGHMLYGEGKVCRVKKDHIRGQMYGIRDRRQSILLTTIRDPSARAISRVFFTEISDRGKKATDRNMIQFLKNDWDLHKGTVGPGTGGFQLFYTSTVAMQKRFNYNKSQEMMVQNPHILRAVVKSVVDSYDFILLVERIDESLVVLQLLMGLTPHDILYTSTNAAGGYRKFKKGRNSKCKLTQKSFISDEVQKFLDSNVWTALNFGDFMLHAAVERSLDLTIESIGQERFHKALDVFLALKAKAEEICAPHINFPCSSTGIIQQEQAKKNCYYEDSGCGYPCFDKLEANYTNQTLGTY